MSLASVNFVFTCLLSWHIIISRMFSCELKEWIYKNKCKNLEIIRSKCKISKTIGSICKYHEDIRNKCKILTHDLTNNLFVLRVPASSWGKV